MASDEIDGRYDIYSLGTDEDSSGLMRYRSYASRKLLFLLLAFFVLFIAVIVALNIGPIHVGFVDVFRYLFSFDSDGNGHIVWNIRLVRIVACVLVGAGLAVAGVVMQSILRNPLASPYTLGLSSAAAFGAAFSIVFLQTGSMITSGIYVNNPYVTILSAFFFSLLATGLILLLVKVTRVSSETMVLAGIAVSAIFTAALSLTQLYASEAQLANIVYWTFGNMGRSTWRWDTLVFIVLLPISVYFFTKRWTYNAMDVGEDTAKGLGVNTNRERMIGMVLASLLSAVIVSFFGTIAFIGLLGPHIARMLIGSDHRYLIPASMVTGAMILLASDLIGLNAMLPLVIPVGIITSMLGGPLFIYLLIRRYRQ